MELEGLAPWLNTALNMAMSLLRNKKDSDSREDSEQVNASKEGWLDNDDMIAIVSNMFAIVSVLRVFAIRYLEDDIKDKLLETCVSTLKQNLDARPQSELSPDAANKLITGLENSLKLILYDSPIS